MDKRLFIQVQGGRKVSGVLRGFDIFLNIVLDDSVEETVAGQKMPLGQVVRSLFSYCDQFSHLHSIGHQRKQCHVHGILGGTPINNRNDYGDTSSTLGKFPLSRVNLLV
jgi:small nuclear ribonucleoprotein (snRNP)-like protein